MVRQRSHSQPKTGLQGTAVTRGPLPARGAHQGHYTGPMSSKQSLAATPRLQTFLRDSASPRRAGRSPGCGLYPTQAWQRHPCPLSKAQKQGCPLQDPPPSSSQEQLSCPHGTRKRQLRPQLCPSAGGGGVGRVRPQGWDSGQCLFPKPTVVTHSSLLVTASQLSLPRGRGQGAGQSERLGGKVSLGGRR